MRSHSKILIAFGIVPFFVVVGCEEKTKIRSSTNIQTPTEPSGDIQTPTEPSDDIQTSTSSWDEGFNTS